MGRLAPTGENSFPTNSPLCLNGGEKWCAQGEKWDEWMDKDEMIWKACGPVTHHNSLLMPWHAAVATAVATGVATAVATAVAGALSD